MIIKLLGKNFSCNQLINVALFQEWNQTLCGPIKVCSFLFQHRKVCVKLLKHLLSLLKEQNSSFEKFCSYYAKTTFFHACCSRNKDTYWSASCLGRCFQLLLQDFIGHLESGVLKNFFIPNQNLLSGLGEKKCKELAQCIQEECDKGFPIFKSYLARDRI